MTCPCRVEHSACSIYDRLELYACTELQAPNASKQADAQLRELTISHQQRGPTLSGTPRLAACSHATARLPRRHARVPHCKVPYVFFDKTSGCSRGAACSFPVRRRLMIVCYHVNPADGELTRLSIEAPCPGTAALPARQQGRRLGGGAGCMSVRSRGQFLGYPSMRPFPA